MTLWLPTALAIIGLASGIGIGRELEKFYPSQPVPRYSQHDCWVENRTREPWELYPDGQVLHVGNRHYLVAPRELIISKAKPKYDGGAVFESMVEITSFDQHTAKVPCPGKWK